MTAFNTTKTRLVCSLGALLAGTTGAFHASAVNAQGATLEEIVVTAQRREQSMQDVPISINTLSAQLLDNSVITSTDNLSMVSPGLVATTNQRTAQFFIRGIGTQSANTGDESNIATYVDGVYMQASQGNIFSFNNVERVEVLKGPQGTLFGRNATGGMIHVITRDPVPTPTLEAGISYGNYETTQGSLYASGGSETLAADISLFNIYQGEGFGENIILGDEVNFKRESAGRTKLLWQPTEEDRITLAADYSDSSNTLGLTRQAAPGALTTGGFGPLPDIQDTAVNYPTIPGDTDLTAGGVSLKYERDLGDINISLLSAYRQEKTAYLVDADTGPLTFFHFDFREKTESLQNEILLNGQFDRLNWTAGVFLFNSDTNFDIDYASIIPSLPSENHRKQNLSSYAGFVEGAYEITDKSRLTLGLRYTKDERKLSARDLALAGNARPPGTVLTNVQVEESWSEPTYRVMYDYDVAQDVLAYASYSRGFKSGVYNMSGPTAPPVEPEILDAYEVGLKSELFDNTLRLNMAAFYYDYQDIQLQRNEAGITILVNAAQAEVYGLELDSVYVPQISVGSLQFRTGFTLLDAEYKKFPNAALTVRNPAGGNIAAPGDASGNKMIRAPEWTFNFGIDYSIAMETGELGFNANYYHSDEYFFEPSNRLTQDAYDVINGQAYYSFGDDGRYRIRLFGSNLTDEEYYLSGSEGGFGDVIAPAAPRTYGLGIDMRLGG